MDFIHVYLFHYQKINFGKNPFVFDAGIYSWRHIDTRRSNILIAGEDNAILQYQRRLDTLLILLIVSCLGLPYGCIDFQRPLNATKGSIIILLEPIGFRVLKLFVSD